MEWAHIQQAGGDFALEWWTIARLLIGVMDYIVENSKHVCGLRPLYYRNKDDFDLMAVEKLVLNLHHKIYISSKAYLYIGEGKTKREKEAN